jgi:hypothetical protein
MKQHIRLTRKPEAAQPRRNMVTPKAALTCVAVLEAAALCKAGVVGILLTRLNDLGTRSHQAIAKVAAAQKPHTQRCPGQPGDPLHTLCLNSIFAIHANSA